MTMNKSRFLPVITCTAVMMTAGCSTAKVDHASLFTGMEGPRSVLLFDDDWRFHLGDAEGAYAVDFDAAQWRRLDLPHDWSIEDIPGTGSPLDSLAVGGIDMGYFRGGTGWYRKTFDLPDDLIGKRFFLQFDGVYMDADVWLNGEHLGNHPYGYTSFWFDITGHLQSGEENVIAVRVRNEGRNSRWYSGSGIYRHVWLTIVEPVHVTPWGTGITTPVIEEDRATVVVTNEIENSSGQPAALVVMMRIEGPDGKEIVRVEQEADIPPSVRIQVTRELQVADPLLWSPGSPVLYSAVTEIRNSGSELLDRVENSFGIRSIRFTTDGFFLNGRNVLLKGGCMHHDNGPLGAAAYDRAEERRVELMKTSGFNSIRCAHNPPSPGFLDACDRLGMMVIDEAFDMWQREKNPQDYHRFFDEWWASDVASMVMRDRNHPSVIMWSSGNEIPERGEPEGVATSEMLAGFIRELDPSRPVTSAVNGLGPDKDPYFATLDVAGYNYPFGGDHGRESIFDLDHRRIPERIMYCSESYPLTAFGAWMDVVDHPFVIGDFVWTGFDYLGEASIGWRGYPQEGSFYPWNHAYCGDLDICGMKRPQSCYRDVLWNAGRQLSIFVQPPEPTFQENPDREEWSKWHWQDVVAGWNWEGYENRPLNVEVYSAHERVELFLNGVSLGTRETNRGTEWIARWEIPYQPGVLRAVAYDGTGESETMELVTAGEPESIHLAADRTRIRADNQDLSYITVELRDGKGIRNTEAENLVYFDIKGPGTILAVASSNPMSTESFRQPRRKAYQGRCMVVVKSTRYPGDIVLTASSGGIPSESVTIASD
jgi:beta-galactosidase